MTCIVSDSRRSPQGSHSCAVRRWGLSLIEALAVVAIMSTLAGLLLPHLHSARGHAKAAYCANHLRQLLIANVMYADVSREQFAPAAREFLRNLERWHGAREKLIDVFDPRLGLLTPFLGNEVSVRQCPSLPEGELDGKSGFERGCGGYGYNQRYIGRQTVDRSDGTHAVVTDRGGERMRRVRRPAETVMFGDAAFAGGSLIEYSFLEPRYHPEFVGFRSDPSTHFRHAGRANLVWCDGHVDIREMTFAWHSGLYAEDPGRHSIGWFGDTDDNSLFDLR